MTGTRPIAFSRADLWAIHDCLTAALAGFGGRAETAEPWHATNLLAKLRPALLRCEAGGAADAVIDLARGEMECIDLNVPRTAYAGAPALLVRVFTAIEELALGMPLALAVDEPAPEVTRDRLAAWLAGRSDQSDIERG